MSRATPKVSAVGVDGCPAGWVAAILSEQIDGSHDLELRVFSDFKKLMGYGPIAAASKAPVFVDMPIGLPEEVGFRECDKLARDILGDRRSCVFQVPDREYLECAGKDWVLCRAKNLERKKLNPEAKGLSRQTYALLGKVKEIDDYLAASKIDRRRVVETHPEVFFKLASTKDMIKKSSRRGRSDRTEILAAGLHGVIDREGIQDWIMKRSKQDRLLVRDAKQDDRIDALAALCSARRHLAGNSVTLPGDRAVPLDASGLPMRIVA